MAGRVDHGFAVEELGQICKKTPTRIHTSDQEMVPRACAGDVQEMPLGSIDVLKVGAIGDRADAGL